MRMTGIGIAAGGLLVLLPASIAAEEVRYRGICDASAAVALDADHFVVGEDEKDVLLVYRRGVPEHVKEVKLIEYLGGRQPDGDLRETDIEGAVRVGDTVYWLGSHGRSGKGKLRKTRQQFFATAVVPDGNVPKVEELQTPPYRALQEALLAEEKFKPFGLADAEQKAPKHCEGFNIEGLTDTPDGHLLIGFRNPRPAGKAIVIPLINPKAVIKNQTAPKFGEPELLDLGGRGITSMERVGERYLIAAGPYSAPDPVKLGADFALYSWGGPGTKPSQIDVDLGTLNPEAVFVIPGTNEFVIISDDGKAQIDGKDCKDDDVPVAQKGFRARTLRLP